MAAPAPSSGGGSGNGGVSGSGSGNGSGSGDGGAVAYWEWRFARLKAMRSARGVAARSEWERSPDGQWVLERYSARTELVTYRLTRLWSLCDFAEHFVLSPARNANTRPPIAPLYATAGGSSAWPWRVPGVKPSNAFAAADAAGAAVAAGAPHTLAPVHITEDGAWGRALRPYRMCRTRSLVVIASETFTTYAGYDVCFATTQAVEPVAPAFPPPVALNPPLHAMPSASASASASASSASAAAAAAAIPASTLLLYPVGTRDARPWCGVSDGSDDARLPPNRSARPAAVVVRLPQLCHALDALLVGWNTADRTLATPRLPLELLAIVSAYALSGFDG